MINKRRIGKKGMILAGRMAEAVKFKYVNYYTIE